jgi:hypothetical protein
MSPGMPSSHSASGIASMSRLIHTVGPHASTRAGIRANSTSSIVPNQRRDGTSRKVPSVFHAHR